MSNLDEDIDSLKKRYREIFIKTAENFVQKLSNIKPENFLQFLEGEALEEVYVKKLEIFENRKRYSCLGCASCCKLACSQFSPDELRQKSEDGDEFAKQFLSVFVPYENEKDANAVYPEYFELLKNKKVDENVYFYHCPKVTEDNRCPDYENRPQICRDFPDNPIGFLPKNCGFTKWKKDCENIALEFHALIEIVDFYKSKIKE